MINGFGYSSHPNNNSSDSNDTWTVLVQGQCYESGTKKMLSKSEILKLYLEYGADCINLIDGHFALIIANKIQQEVFFAIDKIGTYELFYHINKKYEISVNSDLRLIKHLHPNLKISHQSIFDYFYFHMIPAPNCIYENVKRIQGGEFGVFKDKKLNIKTYWEPTFDPKKKTFKTRKKDLFELFEAELNNLIHIADKNTIGAFLSGGIDSSTVLAMLSKIKKKPIDAFTIAFDIAQFDEKDFAKSAAKRFDANHHIHTLTPKLLLELMPKILPNLSQPFGNASIIPTYYCAQLAAQSGIHCLFAGDGGDELFGGNQRYAKQNQFELYHKVPNSIKSKIIEKLVKSDYHYQSKIFNKIQSYIKQAKIPLPERLETYNLIKRLGISKIFSDDFMIGVDIFQPSIAEKLYFEKIHTPSSLNNILAFDYKYTLADNDLIKVRSACRLAGIDVQFPFLFSSLVNFSSELPPSEKATMMQLRVFFKQAIKSLLPAEIIHKTKHGFGMPFGQWTLNYSPLRDYIFSQCENFAKRGFFNPSFITQLLEINLPKFPNYYGVMVWLIVAFESWILEMERNEFLFLSSKTNSLYQHQQNTITT